MFVKRAWTLLVLGLALGLAAAELPYGEIACKGKTARDLCLAYNKKAGACKLVKNSDGKQVLACRALKADSNPTSPASPGTKGESGPPGAPGSPGASDNGAPGSPGARGENGERGPPGSPGPQGSQGDTGPRGIRGEAGPAGPAGADGSPGPAGPAGADGLPGPAGPAGADGAAGPQGLQGLQGSASIASNSIVPVSILVYVDYGDPGLTQDLYCPSGHIPFNAGYQIQDARSGLIYFLKSEYTTLNNDHGWSWSIKTNLLAGNLPVRLYVYCIPASP